MEESLRVKLGNFPLKTKKKNPRIFSWIFPHLLLCSLSSAINLTTIHSSDTHYSIKFQKHLSPFFLAEKPHGNAIISSSGSLDFLYHQHPSSWLRTSALQLAEDQSFNCHHYFYQQILTAPHSFGLLISPCNLCTFLFSAVHVGPCSLSLLQWANRTRVVLHHRPAAEFHLLMLALSSGHLRPSHLRASSSVRGLMLLPCLHRYLLHRPNSQLLHRSSWSVLLSPPSSARPWFCLCVELVRWSKPLLTSQHGRLSTPLLFDGHLHQLTSPFLPRSSAWGKVILALSYG